ncbi:MAG TPA: type II secretion system protein M [Xanthomonadaceae bacterium]|nr:type II secretion system protein M [Xanthomonadaceae bacterium]
MKDWFGRLAPREQRMILLALPLLVLMIGWAFIWHPLAEGRSEWRQRSGELARDVAWMRQTVPGLVGATLQPRESLGPRSLLAVADSSLREAGLGPTLRRIEPASERRVRVWFEQAAFDPVVTWLEGLDRRYGVQVVELAATRRDGAGVVDVRLTLELPASP